MKKLFLIMAGIMFLAVTTSCEHKDLCYNHPEHAHKYHIKVVADYRLDWEECYGGPDWEANWPENYLEYNSLRPGKPSGLRVVNNDEQEPYQARIDSFCPNHRQQPRNLNFQSAGQKAAADRPVRSLRHLYRGWSAGILRFIQEECCPNWLKRSPPHAIIKRKIKGDNL